MPRSRPRLGLTLVTAGSAAQAGRIARALVGERLAGCVNIIGPIASVYRWHEAVESAREYLLLIKGRMGAFGALERRIRELHSYEVPEVVSVGFERGSAAYLRWLLESTRPQKRSRRGRAARSGAT